MRILLTKGANIGLLAALVAAFALTAFPQRRTSKRPAPRSVKPVVVKRITVAPTTAPIAVSRTTDLTNLTIGPGTANQRLRAAFDYDADNKADLTIFRPSDNTWYVKKSG